MSSLNEHCKPEPFPSSGRGPQPEHASQAVATSRRLPGERSRLLRPATWVCGWALLVGVCCGPSVPAQVFNERFEDWPLKLKIDGRVIVASQLTKLSMLRPLLPRSAASEKLLLVAPADQQEALVAQYRPLFGEIVVTANVRDFAEQEQVGAIAWHTSTHYQPAYHFLDRHRAIFQELIHSGRTLIMVGGNAVWCSQWMISRNELPPSVRPGAELMPDCVLQPVPAGGSIETELPKVLSVLAAYPRCVGIVLPPETALALDGRKMWVNGTGKATFALAANARQPRRIESLEPRDPSQPQSTTDWLLDLTEWRRDAIDRTLEPFPPSQPLPPMVEHGTLFIVGGGGLPEGLMQDFVEAAGGREQAELVYVPCAEEDEVRGRPSMLRIWERMGVRNTHVLHTKDRQQADQDEAFYEPLRTATGIWFGGGRQWNFADSYYGTTTHKWMKQVLTRGGAIGGSSAGASIQARYLARATPIENFRIMAPGYERGGLGFLSGVAIDQHFSQRRRQSDMTQLVNRYPQLLGIGIDETTALIVQQSEARVVGEGQVFFYNRQLPVYPDQPDYVALSAGQVYDLKTRKIQSGQADEDHEAP